ncbi:GNAT family N-acetyltransferase [Sphingobacterium corticibacter]|uniref:GNAT family N-acetyltransferase n=1 Tax=Sphingobacterium corticibacter TaxID=2171749 RepID=A0A2T8HIC8_9SPHI|nr:GNAT family N-acetyltransferase [Sphingobacterium corticibacter]PVH25153.1 GNAT family N-acetyltransferase [Sphingobacterium corticibacter]
MEFKHINKGKNGIVLALEDDVQYGEITYVSQGDNQIVIDHTGVESFARGKGIAKALVSELVTIARTENWKVVPLCPFAKAEFDKNASYVDVLA